MLVWLTLPFYDFCGFRSVAVNSVYKLQFFTFIGLGVSILWGVENCHFPLTKPVAVNTGLALPRSLWLCTSSFVYDVVFLSKTTRMFRPVRQVAASEAKSAVSDCICVKQKRIVNVRVCLSVCVSWWFTILRTFTKIVGMTQETTGWISGWSEYAFVFESWIFYGHCELQNSVLFTFKFISAFSFITHADCCRG